MLNISSVPILRNLDVIGGIVDLKKWFFGVGLSAQAIIIVMMFFLLKELRQGPDSYDPYLETTQEFPLAEEAPRPTQREETQIPFSHYVTGKGKVIPSSDYIRVSAPLQGIVKDVYVNIGQKVSAGDPLFKIDDSLLKCRLNERESEVHTTILKLEMLQTEHDQKLGKALIDEKRANCKTIEKQMKDCDVKSPIDGRILSIDVHPGEYYEPLKGTAIVMGADDPLHLRVFVDQKEAWKVTPSPHMRAVAVHKSNPKIHFILEYVSVNPCFNQEQGLELVFAFDRYKNPVYLDEMLDVYIEASSETDRALMDYQFSQIRR